MDIIEDFAYCGRKKGLELDNRIPFVHIFQRTNITPKDVFTMTMPKIFY